jgi:hypothetical protein
MVAVIGLMRVGNILNLFCPPATSAEEIKAPTTPHAPSKRVAKCVKV